MILEVPFPGVGSGGRRWVGLKILFSLVNSSLAPPFFLQKPHLVPPWSTLLVAGWDAAQFRNFLTETIRSSNLLHCIMGFNKSFTHFF